MLSTPVTTVTTGENVTTSEQDKTSPATVTLFSSSAVVSTTESACGEQSGNPTDNTENQTLERVVSINSTLECSLDDLLESMEVDTEAVKGIVESLPQPLTPLRTPVRFSDEQNEEEVIFRLHPSPLPILEEHVSPIRVANKVPASEE